MALDLIMVGEEWGGSPSGTQRLARHLIARGHRVLWVNAIGLRRPRWRDIARVGAKLSAISGRKTAPAPEPGPCPAAILNPLAAPAPDLTAGRWIGRRLLGDRIKAESERLGMRRPLLWSSLPITAYLVDACGEAGVIFYCCDDLGDPVGADRGPVMAYERTLARRASHVLATSPGLARRFDGANMTILPHGVDYQLFATPRAPAPATIAAAGRPIAGFYGCVADWLDRELLADTAALLPDWEFHLVGTVTCDLGRLATLPNVRVLPAVAPSELPGYVGHWTAALLPFRDTPRIRACNPLKLREYLASGTPIVATPFPAAEAYGDVIRIADRPEGFAEALTRGRAEDSADRARRQARVARETWADRALTVETILERIAA